MITISTLQSQIALNRNILKFQEWRVFCYKIDIKNQTRNSGDYIKELPHIKKQIKQYAKLQRALKSELAYRIMYNREMRSNNMDNYQLK